MLDEQVKAYLEEAEELLSELENSLLELEETPEDMELVARVFRAMHTIKGSGAMFGFERVATFTHEVETTFEEVRNGRIPVTCELIDLSLQARDHIRLLLASPDRVPPETSGELANRFRTIGKTPEAPPAFQGHSTASPPLSPFAAENGHCPERTWRIRFRPHPDILFSGTRPVALIDELRRMGPCTVVAQTDAIPYLDAISSDHCYTYWDIILSTDLEENDIRDVFIFVEDECSLEISLIDEHDPYQETGEGIARLGEILVEKGDLSAADLASFCAGKQKFGSALVEAQLVSRDKVQAALAEQQHLQEKKQKKSESEGSSIRVAAERLDKLVDLVGELVTVQSRLTQTAPLCHNPAMISIAEEVERLTAELRDQTLATRMLPIGATFSRFRRLVRDLARDLGKKIELHTYGAETELDKTVIEKLSDPLVHLIRNSIDHGIESPEERRTLDKEESGAITLGASHSGDSVVVEIRDNGRGLKREAIRDKAIRNGLISEQEQLEESELFQLIFAPGFSTAEKITDVSGRGVGMDVVKRAIEGLRGSIEISSEEGQGTCIQIRIPLTLAIIESLLVSIGETSYVLPLASIEECIELNSDNAAKERRQLVQVRGTLVPWISLRRFFAIKTPPPPIQQIMIARCAGQRIGFAVDKVIGEHQTVIKSLGPHLRHVPGVSGATILGDGRVALILDTLQLSREAEQTATQP